MPVAKLIISTLSRTLFLFALAGVLFFWSLTSFLRNRAAFSIIQLLGAGFLVIVVVTHIFEALSWFPSMQWGSPGSAGHYVDLTSAILGLALFFTGLFLRLLRGGRKDQA